MPQSKLLMIPPGLATDCKQQALALQWTTPATHQWLFRLRPPVAHWHCTLQASIYLWNLLQSNTRIWSNMQALAQLFPDVVDYYNTDLPLEVNDNLQPAYKTMQTSQQHTQTLAAVTTTSSCITQSQLHLTMSDDGHPVKTDSLSRDPLSIDSCGALMHNTIQKLNNLTNHILWMTANGAAHPSVNSHSQPPLLTNNLPLVLPHLQVTWLPCPLPATPAFPPRPFSFVCHTFLCQLHAYTAASPHLDCLTAPTECSTPLKQLTGIKRPMDPTHSLVTHPLLLFPLSVTQPNDAWQYYLNFHHGWIFIYFPVFHW